MSRLTETIAFLTEKPSTFSRMTKKKNEQYVFFDSITPTEELKRLRRELKLYENNIN